MSKHNKKWIQLVETGKKLFWQYGIRRVSVEEICEEAKVSKMTFYKYFRNKNDLVKTIMTIVMDESEKKFDMVFETDKHYREKAEEMIRLKMEGTADISKEFMKDYYSLNDPKLLEFLHNRTQLLMDKFLDSIVKAQLKGEVRKEIKPEFIMYFFNHIQSMANDKELLDLYTKAQDLIIELLGFFFHGILADKEED